MLNILPVFLDYVLHPELSDSNFRMSPSESSSLLMRFNFGYTDTEIYHVDGEGKELGVVYCEMLGR